MQDSYSHSVLKSMKSTFPEMGSIYTLIGL